MRRLGLWLLFLLPLGYVGLVVAVTVHEVVGHGGAAVLAGGELGGFNVQFDGMGSAFTYAEGHRTWVYAGGIVAEVLLGALLVAAGALTKHRPLVRAALVLFAMNLFLDGLPYGFWDAIYKGEVGDVGSILRLEAWAPLRVLLIVGLGLLYVGTTALTSRLLFRTVEADVGPLSFGRAAIVAGALFLGVIVGFATFDWNQLIPGAGLVPAIGAGALQLAIAVWLVWSRRREVEPIRVTRTAWSIGIPASWLAAIVVVTIVALWLGEGIYWG